MSKVLLISGDAGCNARVQACLGHIGYKSGDIKVCTDLRQLSKLSQSEYDFVLANPDLPNISPQTAFTKIHDHFPWLPIIVLAAADNVACVLRAIQQGAEDYLNIHDIDCKGLAKSIQYAIERKRRANDYMRLFEENPASMFIFDKRTLQLLAVNSAALYQYGYTREEFLNMTALQIRPEMDWGIFMKANVEVSEKYYDFGRWRHVNKKGELIYVHVYAHTTEFEGRDARLVMAINIDNKIKVEQELYEKEQEKTLILDSINDGFFALNSDWKFTYVNKACERIFRKTTNELVGETLWNIFPDINDLKFTTAYKQAMEERRSAHCEEYYPPFDIWVSVNAYPTKEGMAVYLVDITAQKKAQEQIFNEGQQLKAIINNTKDVIWSIDRDKNIITANEAFWNRIANTTGKDERAFTKADFEETLCSKWSAFFDRAFNGESVRIICSQVLKNNEIFEEISFNPVFNRQGEVIGISCFSRDVTEQHLHIQLIEKQNEQLKQIAWIQSHEVRRPLANILGLTQLFNFEHNNTLENQLLVEKLRQSAFDLDNIIKKITSHTARTRIRHQVPGGIAE